MILAPVHQRRVLVGHNKCMLHRDRRHFYAQQFCRALCMVTGGRDHMFRTQFKSLVRGDQIAALFHHNQTAHDPFGSGPFIAVHLPLANNFHTPLPCAFGHRHRHICRVYIAISGVKNRAFQIFGADQGPAVFDLRRGQPLKRHAHGFCRAGIQHILIHAGPGLGHAQVANHRKTGVQTGFLFQRLIKLYGIIVDMRGCITHVKQRQQSGGMPGGARR